MRAVVNTLARSVACASVTPEVYIGGQMSLSGLQSGMPVRIALHGEGRDHSRTHTQGGNVFSDRPDSLKGP